MIDLQNIIDSNGIGIAITGMLIVFAALSLISLFIALLPRLLEAASAFLPPEKEETPLAPRPATPAKDDSAMIAAIAYVLHKRRQGEA